MSMPMYHLGGVSSHFHNQELAGDQVGVLTSAPGAHNGCERPVDGSQIPTRSRLASRKGQPHANTFAFILVDVQGQEPADTRKFIRSHVMRGKNTKRRSPWARQDWVTDDPRVYGSRDTSSQHTPFQPSSYSVDMRLAPTQSRFPEDVYHQVAPGVAGTGVHEAYVATPRGQPHDMRYSSFAGKVSDFSRYLIHRLFVTVKDTLYPIEWCFHTDLSRRVFFSYLLYDPAYLASAIFISSAMDDSICRNTSDTETRAPARFSPRTQYYLRRTIQLLRQHIQDCSKQIDDSTAAVVGSLALASDVTDDGASCRTHVLGLKRIVQLRGGLEHGFLGNVELKLKILRVDLLWCINTGSKPMFFEGDQEWAPCLEPFLDEYPLYLRPAASRIQLLLSSIDPKLQAVFEDVRNLAHAANTLQHTNMKLPIKLYERTMMSVQYRLLSLDYSLEGDELLCEAIRLGLLTFLTSIFLVTPSLKHRHVYIRVRMQTCIELLDIDDPLVADLQLWLVMLGVAVHYEADEAWLVPCAHKLVAHRRWADCLECLESIAWVNTVHDSVGERAFTTLQTVLGK